MTVDQALWDLAEENGDVRRRGLDSHEINVLPTSKFTENVPSSTSNSDKAVSEDAECRICLSQFQRNDTLRTLPCLHKFHRDCIDNWIQVLVLFLYDFELIDFSNCKMFNVMMMSGSN